MSVTWWMLLIYYISQTSEFWIWKLKHEGDPDPPNDFIFHSSKMTWNAKPFNISYCYLYWKKNKTLHPTKIISVMPANLCFEGSYEMGVIKPHLTFPDPGCRFLGPWISMKLYKPAHFLPSPLWLGHVCSTGLSRANGGVMEHPKLERTL